MTAPPIPPPLAPPAAGFFCTSAGSGLAAEQGQANRPLQGNQQLQVNQPLQVNPKDEQIQDVDKKGKLHSEE